MLSVLIPTLNEQRNIADCIQSVRWADEIVVVDSGSTDGTTETARRLGAKVVDFAWNRRLPKKKNWALDNVPWENDWLLILDADERITPELGREIRSALPAPDVDGYFINRRFMFMGKWIRHCGYFPSWNLRLFRHRKGRFEALHPGDTHSGDNEIHEHLVLEGKACRLRNEMIHFAYPDIFTWMEKHNRYSNWEAQIETGPASGALKPIGVDALRRRRLKLLSRCLPFRPFLRFCYSYFLRGGVLDGYEGFILCRLIATYEMLSVFKAHEILSKKVGLKTEADTCGVTASTTYRFLGGK